MGPKKTRTKIPFNYVTIKTTKSRIDKGLLAIPVSAQHLFPEDSDEVYLVDVNGLEERKSFTPYKSSSRECRIGGMKNFYEEYQIQSGDELVIQVLGNNRFKIFPEKLFEDKVVEYEIEIDKASDDREMEGVITRFSQFVNKKPDDLLKNEYIRLVNQAPLKRKVRTRRNVKKRESVPPSLRRILLSVYGGRCQVSGFTFLMENGKPYFEIHHLKPEYGNHVKNLLVVSPNVHAQFEYAKVRNFFDKEGWLRKVKFNNETHQVFQMIDTLAYYPYYTKEVHSI